MQLNHSTCISSSSDSCTSASDSESRADVAYVRTSCTTPIVKD
jgi:hypothetical protein